MMDNAAVSTVPIQKAGTAAGIFNTMRITGESVAVAGAAALLTTITAAGISGDTAVAGQAIQGHVAAVHREALAAGFTHAFHVLGLVLAVLSAAGAVLTYLGLGVTRRVDHPVE
ncbi:hypothetical protein [Actinocrispum wychmicini]|uniref:hypothetical protein n=1 Tax=Actinocrispum wychmicini TaxID=1213861 RepID=UPI003C7E83E7